MARGVLLTWNTSMTRMINLLCVRSGMLVWLYRLSVSSHGAPHEAVNRLHDGTYMVKYGEAIKYVGSIFILRQKMLWMHLYPGKRCLGGIFWWQHVFPFTTLHLGKFQSGKNKNWAWTRIVRNHWTFTSAISIEHMLIKLKVNFCPKHQLLHYDYHSNGFYPSFYVSSETDNHFGVFHLLFP